MPPRRALLLLVLLPACSRAPAPPPVRPDDPALASAARPPPSSLPSALPAPSTSASIEAPPSLPKARPNPLSLVPTPASKGPPVPTRASGPRFHRWDAAKKALSPIGAPSTEWHTSPGKRAIAVHRYVMASDWDYAVEIFDGKSRVAVYPHVERVEVGPRAARLYLAAEDVDAAGAWTSLPRIVDVDAGASFPLDAPCGRDGRWSGDRLILWSADDPTAPSDTTLCVHDPDGKRAATVAAKLLWHAGADWYLSAEAGLLPGDRDVLWVKELDEAQACTVHLQSLVDAGARASIQLHAGAAWSSCLDAEVDLSATSLAAPKVRFRLHDAAGDWLPWREATLARATRP